MFKRLRRRFIALTMASLLAVLLVILGGINLVNYRNVLRQADAVLDVLAENNGTFPGRFGSFQPETTPTPEPEESPEPEDAAAVPLAAMAALPLQALAEELQNAQQPDSIDGQSPEGEVPPPVPEGNLQLAPDGEAQPGQPMPFPADEDFSPDDLDIDDDDEDEDDLLHHKGTQLSVEAPYESRYFSVRMDDTGSVTAVDIGRIAAVDTDSAVEYAEQALASGKERGFVDNYRFVVTEASDGDTLVIFLDCGRNLDTFRTFLIASVAMAAVGCLGVLLLVVLFSGRIVRPVAESYEKQKRFITDAGHEIKTPLAIIDADADVLELDLEDENNEWLQDIRRQTKRLTELTNDLVYLSRMEEQQHDTAAMVDFPLSDVVSETAQGFQSRALQKEQVFTQTIQPMLTLHGDEKAIRQLTSILLDNAVKYTPEGGKIDLKLEQQGRNIVLTVYNDAASPVPKESMDKLFDRFYRTDPSRSSATGGHGIGLSIARAVVQAHKGKITASTADEKSLKITAVLPAEGK